jgi:RNA polymerase sigma factor (sigma-70 family)
MDCNLDVALLDQLVREHRDAAVGYATRILGDASLAEDAVQRALLQILVRVRAGDDQLLAANPRAVVLRGTRWAALKLADRHISRDDAERRAAAEPLAGGDDHDWDRLEARMLVEELLPSLPQHYRDVLRLRYLEGRPDATAAADLAVTVKAYRRRLDRALVVARMAAMRMGVTSLGAAAAFSARKVWEQVRANLSPGGRLARLNPAAAPSRVSTTHVVGTLAMLGVIAGPVIAPTVGLAPPRTGVLGLAPDLSGWLSLQSGRAVAAGAVKGAVADAQAMRQAAPSPPLVALPGVPIFDIVPAPHVDRNHTIVAEASDAACPCNHLARTTDGGETWTVFRQPLQGEWIILPPDYPDDPRILFGSGVTGVGPCLAPSAESSSCMPIPGGAQMYWFGSVAFDPGFDAGTPLIYTSTNSGVLAYNVDTGVVTARAVGDPAWGFTLPMAPAGGPGPISLYTTTFGPGAGTVPRSYTPRSRHLPALGVVAPPHLVGCDAAGSCHDLAQLPEAPAGLFTPRDDPSGMVVVAEFDDGRFVVSIDGGHTVSMTTLTAGPLELTGAGAQVFMSGGRPVIAVALGAPVTAIATWRYGDRDWRVMQVPPESSDPSVGDGWLIKPGPSQPDRSTGIQCSTDGGRTWYAACPKPAG